MKSHRPRFLVKLTEAVIEKKSLVRPASATPTQSTSSTYYYIRQGSADRNHSSAVLPPLYQYLLGPERDQCVYVLTRREDKVPEGTASSQEVQVFGPCIPEIKVLKGGAVGQWAQVPD